MSPRAGEPEELARFDVASEPGNERIAMTKVTTAVAGAGLTDDQVDRLRTAVAEATMNGIEHGNDGRPDAPVEVAVLQDAGRVVVTVTDRGGAKGLGDGVEAPDLDAKLAGQQSPRGWGLFLIQHMVDEVEDSTEGDRHTVRLVMRRAGGGDARAATLGTDTIVKGGADGDRR